MYRNFLLNSTLFCRGTYLSTINGSQKIDGMGCVCWSYTVVQGSGFLSLSHPNVLVMFYMSKTKENYSIKLLPIHMEETERLIKL